MILVTGATGHLGSATIAHLLKHTASKNIAAFARDESKAKDLAQQGIDVRIGDFDNEASLDKAMQGIEKVLLIPTIDHHRLEQHKRVVGAARNAGVKHIVYPGVSMKDVSTSAVKMIMESHFQTEEYIKQSGLSYTFLRNTLYADMIPVFVGQKVFEMGIHLPAGNGKVAFALRREMGEAAANVLLQQGHENKVYDITGPAAYSYNDIASALTELSGKRVEYTDVDAAALTDILKQAGVPEQAIYLAIGFAMDTKNDQFEKISTDLEQLLGRKPLALKEALKVLYKF